jgi:hypothetical protein
LPNENSVLRINPQTGAVTRVADLGAYERANNPHPAAVDSNLYGIALGPDANLYVADAGGNDLLRVNPSTGQVSLVTVFPPLATPPGAVGPPQLEPVPTGVAVGPDGGFYVGFLGGGPFPEGAAKAVRVAPNGQLTDVATALTAVVGLAFGPDRMLYVSEIFSRFDLSTTPPTPRPGRVRRVLPDGTTQDVADELPTPNGIAFDRAGNLYVVVNSAFTPPQAGPQGQVLRCDRIAAAAPDLPRTGGAGSSGRRRAAGAFLGRQALRGRRGAV